MPGADIGGPRQSVPSQKMEFSGHCPDFQGQVFALTPSGDTSHLPWPHLTVDAFRGDLVLLYGIFLFTA